MAITKINESNKGIISALSDQPPLTASEIKSKFDRASDSIINYINDTLVPEVEELFKGKEDLLNLSGNKVLISTNSACVGESNTTSEEIGFLSGVTSAIQTQLDKKENSISLTGGKAVISDENGKLKASEVLSANLRNITYGSEAADNSDELPEGSIYLKVIE